MIVLLSLLFVLSPVQGFAADREEAAQGLRKYCKSCHGVGELRFIYSPDDGELWDYLFRNDSPNLKRPWSEAILQVLDWPSDQPPPADIPMVPPDRDWMPKGIKRRFFARAQTEDGENLRRVILRALKDGP